MIMVTVTVILRRKNGSFIYHVCRTGNPANKTRKRKKCMVHNWNLPNRVQLKIENTPFGVKHPSRSIEKMRRVRERGQETGTSRT